MKILSFGEIIWDIYHENRVIGGAPMNFCAHTVMCGAEGYMISAVGTDELGRQAFEALKRLDINSEFITESSKATGQCLVSLNANGVPQYNVLNDVSYDYMNCSDSQLTKINEKKFDAFYFGTLAQRNQTSRKTLIKILESCFFSQIFCDLNLRPDCYDEQSVINCLSHATVLKCSEEEMPLLKCFEVWKKIEGNDVNETVNNLFDQYSQLDHFLYTCGADGAIIFERGKSSVAVPAKKTRVVSTVGAGDSFGAVWLYLYMLGKTPDEAAKIASLVSAYVVSVNEAVPMYKIDELVKSEYKKGK